MHVQRVIPSIEDSIDISGSALSVSERYYTHYYFVPKYQLLRPRPPLETSSVDASSIETTSLEATIEKTPSVEAPKEVDHVEKVVQELARQSKEVRPHDDCENDDSQEMPRKKQKLSSVSDEEEASNEAGGDLSSANSTDDEISRQMEGTVTIAEDLYKPEYRITGEETLVMAHSNKLCVVSLSPFHPIVRNNLVVTKVEFSVHGVDRLSNKVSGKSKRGAQIIGSKATVCRLHTDAKVYSVQCGARGKLVQVNSRLVDNPDLSRTGQGREGFLAVVLPSLPEYDTLVKGLVTAGRYEKMWSWWQDKKAQEARDALQEAPTEMVL